VVGQETALSRSLVLILDCGAQYTKVIDRQIRALNIETLILPVDTPLKKVTDLKPKLGAIILSGGPHSVYEPDAPLCHVGLFELGIPILGICYGMQLLCHLLGGKVESTGVKEYGETEIQLLDTAHLLLANFQSQQTTVLMSHGDSVTQLPQGFEVLASTEHCPAIVANTAKQFYGVQFHPEVELTQEGTQLLKNFVFNIAGVNPVFRLENRLEQLLVELKQQVGAKPVVVLVSGGVDSTVVAALLLKALPPEQVFAIHVDTGLMRDSESALVLDSLRSLGLKHLHHLQAQEPFLTATTVDDNGNTIGPLNQATDPEEKRRLIGDTFFHLANDSIKQLLAQQGLDIHTFLLAQGTLRPDLIESGNKTISATAHKIKTHHNDVPLIQQQREKGLVIEPNKDLHKDEVRQIGRLLGLSDELVERQPFPGPGLGVRILCTTEPYGLDTLQTLQPALENLIQKTSPASLENTISATALPIKAVGVQGDGRTYAHCVALQSPTAFTKEQFPILQQLAQQIPNQLPQVNRVILKLDNTHTPLPIYHTVTPTTLTPAVIQWLQAIDKTVTTYFQQHNLLGTISQLLTVALPIDPTQQNLRSIVIRAVITSDYMTARPALPLKDFSLHFLPNLALELKAKHPNIANIFYDLTGKPPATIEWE
jgi:GMP synthase (glutamine-hydrolysing)